MDLNPKPHRPHPPTTHTPPVVRAHKEAHLIRGIFLFDLLDSAHLDSAHHRQRRDLNSFLPALRESYIEDTPFLFEELNNRSTRTTVAGIFLRTVDLSYSITSSKFSRTSIRARSIWIRLFSR